MRSYVEVAKELPVPSDQQTHEFADYVTGAHSWYKHLSLFEASAFVFYLDPNAGRAMIRTHDGDAAFVDHDESTKLHYTWQRTTSYRERFGYWNYGADYGTSLRYSTQEGVVDTAGPGLRVQSPEGEWAGVPEPLVRAGTAKVSSLMYYADWFGRIDQRTQSDHETRLYSLFWDVPVPFGFSLYADRLARLAERLTGLPDDIAGPFRRLAELWTGETYRREKAEVRRDLEALNRKAYATGGPIDPILKAGGGDALRKQSEEAWERTESRRRELELIPPLIAALDRERERQVAGMRAAMNCFIEMLHAK